MAKKKLSRKELKEQKRQTVQGVRQERAWEPPEPGITSPPTTEMVQDMAMLFGNSARPTPKDLEVITRVVTESGSLIGEPEFEELLLDPMKSANLYLAAAQTRGIAPDALDALAEDEGEEVQDEILTEVGEELVTPEVRLEILAALEQLRQRFKVEGKRLQVAEVAALQVALQSGMSKASEWAGVALVQALTVKSVEAGLELAAKTNELLAQTGIDLSQYETLEEMVAATDPLVEGDLGTRLMEQLEQVPGMAAYLAKQTDEAWAAGINDLFSYELLLGLYHEEELEEAAAIFESFAAGGEGEPDQIMETEGEAIFGQWEALVRRIFADPARLEQARVDLVEVLEEGIDLEEQDVYFVQMAIDGLAEENAVEDMIGFLTAALIGELRWQVEVAFSDEEWDEWEEEE
jgi:hypothetical protein